MTDLKRVNITIPKSYYDEVKAMNLNLSGLVREAVEDQLNPHKITISVSKKTHKLYMQLFNQADVTDKEFEPFLKEALKKFIEHVIKNKNNELNSIKENL